MADFSTDTGLYIFANNATNDGSGGVVDGPTNLCY